MMSDVRESEIETVIVYSFSRYARSTGHLIKALEEFKKLNVQFISITENIDTNSPLGTAIFSILGAVAQLERDLIAERVRNGLANARAKGIRIGRVKTRPSELIRTLYKSSLKYKEIARISKCSTGAVGVEVRALKKEMEEAAKVAAITLEGKQLDEPQGRTYEMPNSDELVLELER